MIIPSNLQVLYFIYSIAAGIAVGILVDCYRSIRYWCRPKGFLTAISDVLFWILCAFAIFIFFLYTNNGDFRYYTIIGMVLGTVVYYNALSRVLLKGMKWIIYYTGKIVRLLFMLIMFPIKAAIYIVKVINSFISDINSSLNKKLASSFQKLKKVKNKEGKSKVIKNKINTNKNTNKKKVKNKSKKSVAKSHTKEKVS